METTSAKPGQTFVENWIVIHHYRILKYFYFNISYKGKIDSLIPPKKIKKKIFCYVKNVCVFPRNQDLAFGEMSIRRKVHSAGCPLRRKVIRRDVFSAKCHLILIRSHLASKFVTYMLFLGVMNKIWVLNGHRKSLGDVRILRNAIGDVCM
jgi:hypothetical protein